MATPTLSRGLVYATDSMRMLHCLDAATGASVWSAELDGELWASALVADGKVYVGTRRGDFRIFADARVKQELFRVNVGAPISATATAANGTVYVASMNTVFAIASPGADAGRR
jgi:outer membrane protein assembly factor BamB